MKPREFMTFGALFYLVLSDVYGLFRQRVILTVVRIFEKMHNKKGNFIMRFPFLLYIFSNILMPMRKNSHCNENNSSKV